MLIKKISAADVIQVFDTELMKFVSQELVVANEVEYEDEDGNPLSDDLIEETFHRYYLPFEMVQPDDMKDCSHDVQN